MHISKCEACVLLRLLLVFSDPECSGNVPDSKQILASLYSHFDAGKTPGMGIEVSCNDTCAYLRMGIHGVKLHCYVTQDDLEN